MNLHDLSLLLGQHPPLGHSPDLLVAGIRPDSRAIRPGEVFVALRGTRVDGHDHVQDALARGAIAAIVEADKLSLLPPGPWLGVPDTSSALATVAAAFHCHPADKLEITGVTGTNGKTTVTHMLEAGWRREGVACGLVGTLGARHDAGGLVTHIDVGFTTPQADVLQELLALMVDARVRRVAMEVSSHALDQRRVGAISFRTAVFTNLSQDHLDYHGTMEAYAAAKARLFEDLSADGLAVVHADDPAHARMIRDSRGRTLTFGMRPGADVGVEQVRMTAERTTGMLVTPSGRLPLELSLPGGFNLANALAAVAAEIGSGRDPVHLLTALSRMPAVAGRLERVSPPDHPFHVLVDYAHTPDGLNKVLEAVRTVTPGRVIVVFGCGGDRDKGKRPLMGRAAAEGADVVIATSDNPRSEDPLSILADIAPGLPREAIVEPDRGQAIRKAVDMAQTGDTVLIAGKGHEAWQIIGEKRIAFDDRQVARLALGGHFVEGPTTA
ncbi:MAG: UDP-N-acetylmuramoyl-L-alanyl-D-glutamate--2,6-diaminopimelate ligase [Candidatus Sericytochromatia bacterium]|nr:UDP-N-acetylmuramoyl-L-alanyl-D-glutamate--2,6-diaminopimelate ligase [Candidatus Sericytochromatia bacterium]